MFVLWKEMKVLNVFPIEQKNQKSNTDIIQGFMHMLHK